jgi:SWI/SNF-related matrix-associated actin-dependent regulator 1 of chromatin subfamily A
VEGLKKELVTRNVLGQNRYVFLCEFQDRHIPKDAGFQFDFNGARHWYTFDIRVAARLRNYARGALRNELDRVDVKQRPILSFNNGLYVWKSEPQYFDYARRHGFTPSGVSGIWTTRDLDAALKLINYADEPCKQRLRQAVEERREATAASRALDADIEIPVPTGLRYFGYQRAAVRVALAQFAKETDSGKPPGVLFGDDMGLGKSVETIATLNHVGDYGKTLIVCPASLKVNWYRELMRWLVRPRKTIIADGSTPSWKLDLANIVIANYDILGRLMDVRKRSLPGKKSKETVVVGLGKLDYAWDFLVCDEAHLLKNPNTMRAQVVFSLCERAYRIIFATGSPILNEAEEIYTLLHALDPAGWPRAYRLPQLKDLQERLRGSGIMVRRLKSEVLSQLPAKLRQVIEVDGSGDPHVRRALTAEAPAREQLEQKTERLRVAVELSKASDDPRDYEKAVAALDAGVSVAFEEMSRVRHQTARAKLPFVIEHLRELIDQNPEQKVVVMAWHQDVIEAIAKAFGSKAVMIYGKVSSETRVVGGQTTSARQQAVDRFQEDPSCQLIICQIKAGGVGLTLTASSLVVFAELHWVPGEMTQAEDRLHRIGQTENVLVQHVVLRDSLDSNMARTLIAKQAIIDQALDQRDGRKPPAQAGAEKALGASEAVSRDSINSLASSLGRAEVEAIHAALKSFSGLCKGSNGDESTFNGVDVALGCELAGARHLTPRQAALGKELIARYHKLLPEDLLKRAGI